MANILVKNGSGSPGSGAYRGVWQASQVWAVGDRIVANNVISHRVMECTAGGAGGSSEPTWNVTTGGTTADGVATFTTRLPSTWANATTDLTRAAAGDASGDLIYVSHQHSESTAAAVSLTWAGSLGNPTRVFCVDDTSGDSPTVMATSAVVATTGASDLTPSSGGYVHFYGIRFKAGDGASAANLVLNGSSGVHCKYEACYLELGSTNASNRIDARYAETLNTWFKFGNASQYLTCASGHNLIVNGGGIEAGSAAVTAFCGSTWSSSRTIISGFDFSAAAATLNVFGNSAVGTSSAGVVRNCKMPAAWSGSVCVSAAARVDFMLANCDSGDTQYRMEYVQPLGKVRHQVGSFVRVGGASDGYTPFSWVLEASADAEWKHQTCNTPEIVRRNKTTGMPITVTAYILRDSATALTNKEVWLEVMYLGMDGFPLGAFVDDSAGSYLAAAADQDPSTETWDTTGMSNPNKQKLHVTFTPRERGFIHAVVKCAKASATVYVCPKLEVTV